jgi:DNA-binding XRE family transcriptional regulator
MSNNLINYAQGAVELCWVSNEIYPILSKRFFSAGMWFCSSSTEDPDIGFSIFVGKTNLEEAKKLLGELIMLPEHELSDVFEHTENLTDATDANNLIERQELFCIDLTQQLRHLRRAFGLTQSELAHKMGVTQSWVSKLESANNDHTFESILSYLDALNCNFCCRFTSESLEFNFCVNSFCVEKTNV